MALRGKKPEAIQKRLKALFFGVAGVGKTTAAIQLPGAYLIDTERGAENEQYTKMLNAGGGAYFFTADFDELLAEVTSLLTEKHNYRTLIIDPLTVVYNDLLDKSAKSLATKDDPEGMAFGRHKSKADRKVKHLMNLLLRLDMNVIITSHAKIVWGDGMKNMGNTFDCYAKLDYLFDLVFEIQRRGKERIGVVRKTRLESFPEGNVFPFSYEEIATRYGRDILERKAEVEALASADQVARITYLIDLLKIPAEVIDKRLYKAQAESVAELPTVVAQQWIAELETKLKGAA